MKITKTPTRRLQLLPPKLQEASESLLSCTEAELITVLADVSKWTFPRGDIYQWVSVLNRFDEILVRIVNEFDFVHLQRIRLDDVTRKLLLSILGFTKLLLEHCSNRTLYQSYDRLNELLCTRDLDLLEAVLWLLVKPAQRLGMQKSTTRNLFSVSAERVFVLTQPLVSTKDSTPSIETLASQEYQPPPEALDIAFSFYRTQAIAPTSTTKTATPTELNASGFMATSETMEGQQEGQVSLQVNRNIVAEADEGDLATKLVHQYNIPYPASTLAAVSTDTASSLPTVSASVGTTSTSTTVPDSTVAIASTPPTTRPPGHDVHDTGRHHPLALLHRIRIAKYITDASTRRQLLTIRCLAITVYLNMVTEETAQSKMHLYEPTLALQLADVAHPDKGTSWTLRTAALFALEGVGRQKSHLNDVLTALNASVSHGLFYQILRRLVDDMHHPNQLYPTDYVNGLFSLLNYFITVQSSGTILINSGIIGILVEAFKVTTESQLKNVSKIVATLDSIVYGFTAGFNAFLSASGLSLLVERLEKDVKAIARADAPEPSADQQNFTKTMLKFTLHTMQSVAHPNIRNLIDTTLPISLGLIFDHANRVNPSILGNAINIFATFVHNEPTSLAILQESKLPNRFLSAISKDLTPSSEVVMALPNAFGAICLNSAGLELLKASEGINTIFKTFTSVEHARLLNDNDYAPILGGGIDELIRHQPSLKDIVMQQVLETLDAINACGRASDVIQEPLVFVVSDDAEMQDVTVTSSSAKAEERPESEVSILIDYIAKFLEGLFQTANHSREFVQLKGHEKLLGLFSIPALPFDFASSAASYSLSHTFRILAETDAVTIAEAVLTNVVGQLSRSQFAQLGVPTTSIALQFINVKGDDKTDTGQPKTEYGEQLIRELIALHAVIGLLSDVYSPPTWPGTKSMHASARVFINSFVQENIVRLAHLHRNCTLEAIWLRQLSEPTLYNDAKKTKSSNSIQDSLGVQALDENIAVEIKPNTNDARYKNTMRWKALFTQISNCCVQLIHGVARLFNTRRPDANTQRVNASISTAVVTALSELLSPAEMLNDATEVVASVTLQYLANVIGLYSLVIFDEKSHSSLHTGIVVTMQEKHNFDELLRLIDKVWRFVDARVQTQDDAVSSPDEKAVIHHAKLCLDIGAMILAGLVSGKGIQDSPYTQALGIREGDKREPYNSSRLVIELRMRTLPFVLHWMSTSYVRSIKTSTLKACLRIIVDTMKGEYEKAPARLTPMEGLSIPSSLLRSAARSIAPDPTRVQQLMEIGLSQNVAEHALIRCYNNVDRAAEYAFTHPELEALPPPPRRATAQTEPEAGTSAQSTEQSRAPNEQTVAGLLASSSTITPVDQIPINDVEMTESVEDTPTGLSNTQSSEEMTSLLTATENKSLENPLIVLRLSVRNDVMKHCIELVEINDEVVFEVKTLLLVLLKDQAIVSDIANELIVLVLANIRNSTHMQSIKRLRLLALIVNDTVRSQGHSLAMPYLRELAQLLAHNLPVEGHPELYDYLALTLEPFLSIIEEPESIAFPIVDEYQLIPRVPIANPTRDELKNIFDEPLRQALLLRSLDAVKHITSKDTAQAALRMLVSLTRDYTPLMLDDQKLADLLPVFRRGDVFENQQPLTLLILRHLVETAELVQQEMEDEIKAFLKSSAKSRSRGVEVATLIRNQPHIALRDPTSYVRAVTSACKFAKYDPLAREQLLVLRSEDGAISDAPARPWLSAQSTKPSQLLMNFLVGSLFAIKDQPEDSDPLATSKHAIHVQRCLILQCLSELAASYMSCKLAIIEYSRRRSRDSLSSPSIAASTSTPMSGSIQKLKSSAFVNYLVNDLCPWGGVHTSLDTPDPVARRKILESHWATSVLASLCLLPRPDSEEERNYTSNINTVRKIVLDAIARAFATALSSSESVGVVYGRYIAIADVCYKILVPARPDPRTSRTKPEEISTGVVRIMLERNFVSLFTLMLERIDIAHPDAQTVVTSVLVPLELLTKVSVKLGRVTESKEKSTGVIDARTPARNSPAADYGHQADDAEAALRHTTLQLMPGVESTDHMESGDDEANIYNDDDDDMYDEIDTSSDRSEEDDDEMEEDVNMEIVIRPEHLHNVLSHEPSRGAEDEEDEHGMAHDEADVHDFDEEDEDDQGEEDGDDDDTEDGHEEDEHGGDLSSDDEIMGIEDEAMHWENGSGDDDDSHHVHSHQHQHHRHHHLRQHGVDVMEEGATPLNYPDNHDHYDHRVEDNAGEDDENDEHGEEEDGLDDEEDDLDGLQSEFVEGTTMIQLGELLSPAQDMTEDFPVPRRLMHTLRRRIGTELNLDADNNGRALHVQRSGLLFGGERRSGLGLSGVQSLPAHPLLSERPNSVSTTLDFPVRGQSVDPANNESMRVFEQLLGDNAMQYLEQLINRTPRGTEGQYRIALDHTLPSNGTIARGTLSDPFRIQSELTRITITADPIGSLHEFTLTTTVQRWYQEARMLFGQSMNDKASSIAHEIAYAMLPEALKEHEEAEKEAKMKLVAEQEKRTLEEAATAAEDARKKKEEEEGRRQTEEEQGTEMVTDEDVISTNQSSATPNNEIAIEAPTQPARVFVSIGSQRIDITDTGIDPTFLEALPDELRLEVINQHFLESGQSMPVNPEQSIEEDFLNALPLPLRMEIFGQGGNASMRRRPQQPVANASIVAPLLSSITSLSTRGQATSSTTPRRLTETPTDTSTNVVSKKLSPKEAVHLLEKPQLTTLVRLLYAPELSAKASLQKIFLSLCENSKSRAELLSVLVGILKDGDCDLSTLDNSLSQHQSLHTNEITKSKQSVQANEGARVIGQPSQVIAHQTLEIILYLVSHGEGLSAYFVSEQVEQVLPARSRKSKGKEKSNASNSSAQRIKVYPLVWLLRLLDRSLFSSNVQLLEQLCQLLSVITKHVSVTKPVDTTPEASAVPTIVDATEETLVVIPVTSTTAATAVTTASDNVLTAPPTNILVSADDIMDTSTIEKKPDTSNATPKQSKETHFVMPVIPAISLQSLIGVLIKGECPIKTFQYVLTCIQHIGVIPANKAVLIAELQRQSHAVSRHIAEELALLEKQFATAQTSADVDSQVLERFAQPTSNQAKLLRTLKTLDFIYNKVKLCDEQDLAHIFKTPDLERLWASLSGCLDSVRDKAYLLETSSLLLPLIESLMVVSRQTLPQKITQVTSVEVSPAGAEHSFYNFTISHRKLLNMFVRNNPNLLSGSFSVLVLNPKVLEFDNKRAFFNQQLHRRPQRDVPYTSLQLNVRRSHVFEDSYHKLQHLGGNELKYGRMNVRFYDEEGVDAGGVTREWYSVLARQIFNPDYALFHTSAVDKVTYQPNRASWVNPDHLAFFRFVGRFIGKAVYDGRLLDCYFTRSFYKHILGKAVDIKDMEAVDPEYYKSLEWMLNNEIGDLMDLTFSIEADDFGRTRVIDLKENGRNIPVTDENKGEYVQLIVEQKLTLAIKDQIEAFLGGFHDVVSKELISIFNEQELELLISGLPDIDVDDWKNNTEFQNYTASSPQIQWFWRAVRSFDQEQKAKLVQFTTGTSKVPLEGFKALQGSSGVQKFQIVRDPSSTQRLPSAHTCFNQLDLPVYESYEQLRTQLLKAVQEGNTGFGFA